MIIRKEIVSQWLASGSSPVDWCEENYQVSGSIAEFTNTLSNIMFFLIPTFCLGTGVWKSYARYVSVGAYIQLIFFMIVGISSAYFHATLSLFGQMLDEVAILWLLCVSYSFLTPNKYRPKQLEGVWAHVLALVVASCLTIAWFVAPQLNAYALFVVAIPIILMKVNEITVYKNPATLRMAKVALSLTLIGIAAWIADKFMCGFWKSLRIPGLHNIWHILIAISSYLDITLFGYLRSLVDTPHSKPSIRYWPGKTFGLPYVHCRGTSR
uniref:Alkaline ceramidase n=1 Tax=Hirondellea gigas TaxID=1518452 RepID=A0A2P2I5H5_9CRUS